MTSYATLRDGIAGVLAGITNIGAVHSRERFVVDPAGYLDMFKVSIGGVSQIRAWLVLRESVVPIYDAAFDEDRRRHLFVVRGYLGFTDATDSYGTLQGLCDSAMAALDNQTTLGLPGTIVRMVGPCTLRSFGTGQFGSVMAHIADIEVPVDVMAPLGTS